MKKNRKFLVPLAALASVFVANPASALTKPVSSVEPITLAQDSQIAQKNGSDVFAFTLKRSDQEILLAGHRSHSSHSSHSSHRSHYSSR